MESLKQNWVYILIFFVLLIVMIIVWRKAIRASREAGGRRKALMSKLDRIKLLSEKYQSVTPEIMGEIPNSDLIDVVMIHIWKKLGSEKEELENFKRLSSSEKDIYTAWYIREETMNEDLASFYRNCGHALSEFSFDVFSHIDMPSLLPIMRSANEMFDENTDISCDKASKEKLDREFKAAFDEAEFERASAKFIRDNTGDFTYIKAE